MAEYKDNHDSVGIQITTSKMNEKNYLLWAQSVWVYLGAKRKVKFITPEKLSFSDAKSLEIAEEGPVWLS